MLRTFVVFNGVMLGPVAGQLEAVPQSHIEPLGHDWFCNALNQS